MILLCERTKQREKNEKKSQMWAENKKKRSCIKSKLYERKPYGLRNSISQIEQAGKSLVKSSTFHQFFSQNMY